MAKKVFQLAKELGMTGKQLVAKCKGVGIDLKGHMAPVDDRTARMLKAMFPPPSPEEQARRAAAERAKKAKAKPKAKKKKKVAKKKVTKKVAKKKKKGAKSAEAAAAAVEAPAAEEAEGVGEGPEEPATLVKKGAAKAAAKKSGKKEKKEKKEKRRARKQPEKPIIEFHFAGEADGSTEVLPEIAEEAAETEPEAPPGATPLEEIPRTRIEALLADRRWEKLVAPGKVRSARAQASSRFGGRVRRGRRSRRQKAAGSARRPVHERPRGEVEITPPITVRKLCEKIGVRLNVVMGKLLQQGTPVNINDILPEETAQLLAVDFDVDLKVRRERDLEEELEGLLEREVEGAELVPRAPVVTLLGHVDHGKTSLLDRIRQTDVAGGEAGGITQHIGAYTVRHGSGFVTFIDTPGHEAFTEMRARGANVTDIAVLVVAADDGIMPQTEEAISHARAAGVPIVVALNKVDLPNADPTRAKQQLTGFDLASEEWGGQTGVVECSAVTGQGIEELLERLALEAEILELRAAPGRAAQGFVLEAEITEDRGIIATALVRDGTLRRGDVILSSHGYGRVRSLLDHRGSVIEGAGPSVPVEVTGLSELPDAGDRFYVLQDLDKAREIAAQRKQAATQAARAAPRHVTLETLTQQLAAGETVELKVVLKADVKGTLEAILPQLRGVGTAEATVNVIHQGVGAVNTSDVRLADASDAIVIGFGVDVDATARQMGEDRSVDVRLHKVIYELLDEVKRGLEGKLAPEEREVVTGHAEVRQLFKISRLGTVAGCYVLDGEIERSNRVRITRDGGIVHEGRIEGLRRFKEDVREVRTGFECGIKVEGFDDIREGDRIEAYRMEEVARTL